MRRTGVRLGLGVAGVAAFCGIAANVPTAPDGKVTLRVVTYPQLAETIKKLNGKVVLVDFWADYCVPCKREFPHFVELHQKYGAAGLAAVSVSLDDPTDSAARERVEAFLQAQHATGLNLLLNETPEVWQAKLKTQCIPCVYLFDRHGKLRSRWVDDEVDYRLIAKRVGELLRE